MTETIKYGYLAETFAKVQLEPQVLKSARGYYIGTASDGAGPVSRESQEYWRTKNRAEEALSTGKWTQRFQP